MIYSLTPFEKESLLEVAQTGYSIHTTADFRDWIGGPVKMYFPHEMMVGALSQIVGTEIRVRHLVGGDCPDEYLEQFSKIADLADCQIVRRLMSEYRAQIVDCSELSTRLSCREQAQITSLGLTNLAVYGLRDIAGDGSSYFCFSKIPGTLIQRHGYLLELLVPYLHQALTRVSCNNALQPVATGNGFGQLTKREREILLLMATGMSNRAIAKSLSRSEQTVQNHVHAILEKIGAPNRTAAAVWIANRNGHFDPSKIKATPGLGLGVR